MTESKLTHEQTLLAALAHSGGVDPYELAARRLFGVAQASSDQRRCAKSWALANCYGAKPSLLDGMLRGHRR